MDWRLAYLVSSYKVKTRLTEVAGESRYKFVFGIGENVYLKMARPGGGVQ